MVDRGSCLDRLAEFYRCSHVVKISNNDASYLAPTEDPPDAQTAVPTTPVVVSDTIGAGADPARHRELSTRWSR